MALQGRTPTRPLRLAPVLLLLLALAAAAPPDSGAAKRLQLADTAGRPLKGPYAGWARAAHVPLPSGRVRVSLRGCPRRPDLVGCVITNRPRTIHLSPRARRPRWVFLHELGHVFDLTVMGARDRRAFRRSQGRGSRGWWRGERPLGEWFAEAYSLCARFGSGFRATRVPTTYGYRPGARRHRAACAVIRRAARGPRRRPRPPRDTPPRVTEPPPAPAPPPAEGGEPKPDEENCFLFVFCG